MKNKRGVVVVDDDQVKNDPLEVLGDDLMTHIFEYLDARSLTLSLLVSRAWFSLASADRLWSPLAAPQYWKDIDPYWGGAGPLMRRYFHPDGSLSADPNDKAWGGHESTYSIVTTIIVDGGVIRENSVRVNRWPRMKVSRREDWGWKLSNVIVEYSSIPDADKEGGTGPMTL